jgi:DNA-binding transcriptional ArsR family regulator
MSVDVKNKDPMVSELGPALKALADPTRLKIILMLREREQCTCHLTADLGLTQGTISHHMAVLKKAGLIRERQDDYDARWVHYSLNERAAKGFIDQVTSLLDTTRTDPSPADCRGICLPKSHGEKE